MNSRPFELPESNDAVADWNNEEMAKKMGKKGNWMWDRRMEGGEGQRGKLEAGERDGVSGRLTGRIGERDGREGKLDVG